LGPPSYMWSIIDRNFVMCHMTVFNGAVLSCSSIKG